MKKNFRTLCAGVFAVLSLSACSPSSEVNPAERAAEIIETNGWELPSTFSQMDSVFGYPDAFNCEVTGAWVQWRADSMLIACQANGTVAENIEKLHALGETAFSLSKGVAKYNLQNELAHTPKEFVGYRVCLADSLSDDMFEVLMDKDMKRVGIRKIRVDL